MRHLLIFLFTLPFTLHAQKLLKGVVLDEKNDPVPSASIFLSNTSIGTTADAEGKFQLYIPAGKYDLIISSVGFITSKKSIVSGELQDFTTVKLQIKAPELETIKIEPFEKNGWQKWGRFFIDKFIGTSSYASDCKIKNPEVLRFRNSKKTNRLTTIAMEPLIIENAALGYVIRYQLETFEYDFKTHYLIYKGFPFFQQMEGNENKQKKWEKERKDVYEGSLMHFMRCLYRNTFSQQGFEIMRVKKVPDPDKQNVTGSQAKTGSFNIQKMDEYPATSEGFIDLAGEKIISGDSITYSLNKTTVGLQFDDYLMIVYKNKRAPNDYIQQMKLKSDEMISEIILVNHVPIEIQSNGIFYDPTDLLTTGYWAWSEKIAMLLPYDFK